MAKDFSRSHRVAEQMQRELADLLQFEVKDPRVKMVTITAVEVTGDM
ncbi:MAG: ribosome-binding factor A, partial [Methylotenera sp.]